MNWEQTAEYYERLANLRGRDPYSRRALSQFAETCRARMRSEPRSSSGARPRNSRAADQSRRGEARAVAEAGAPGA